MYLPKYISYLAFPPFTTSLSLTSSRRLGDSLAHFALRNFVNTLDQSDCGPWLTNMENSNQRTVTGRHIASEGLDYDLYVDREDSNQLLTPPVRSVLVTLLSSAVLIY